MRPDLALLDAVMNASYDGICLVSPEGTFLEMNGAFERITGLDRATWVGRTIAEADVPEGLLVGVVVRDGQAMIAKGGTRLAAGDRLVLVRTADPEGIAAVEAWVGPTQPA